MNPKIIRQELCERYGYSDPAKYVATTVNTGVSTVARCLTLDVKAVVPREKRTGHGQASIVVVSFQKERSKS